MRRLPTLLAAALLAAAVASLIAVAGGSAQAPAAQTLTLVERSAPGGDVVIDVPPVGKKDAPPSPGDYFLSRSSLTDVAGARLGTTVSRCTFLKVTKRVTGSRILCEGVYALAGGTITAQAYLTINDRPFTFAVTGGTGAYEGVRGSGTSTFRPGDRPLTDTVIRLL